MLHPLPPLTARSVIASNLLGMDPPQLSARALVESGRLHGLKEGAVRTAISRLVAAGELEAVAVSDHAPGYRLAGRLLERHGRQQAARHFDEAATGWDGTWELALVTTDRRPAAERAALRHAAGRRQLAEVREGVWARPANLPSDRSPTDAAVVARQCTLVAGARPQDVSPFVAAFDLGSWAAGAAELLERLGEAIPALAAGDIDVLPASFVLAAAGVRHVGADPLLPKELLPEDWPGPALRREVRRFEAAYKQTWLRWFRQLG